MKHIARRVRAFYRPDEFRGAERLRMDQAIAQSRMGLLQEMRQEAINRGPIQSHPDNSPLAKALIATLESQRLTSIAQYDELIAVMKSKA